MFALWVGCGEFNHGWMIEGWRSTKVKLSLSLKGCETSAGNRWPKVLFLVVMMAVYRHDVVGTYLVSTQYRVQRCGDW